MRKWLVLAGIALAPLAGYLTLISGVFDGPPRVKAKEAIRQPMQGLYVDGPADLNAVDWISKGDYTEEIKRKFAKKPPTPTSRQPDMLIPGYEALEIYSEPISFNVEYVVGFPDIPSYGVSSPPASTSCCIGGVLVPPENPNTPQADVPEISTWGMLLLGFICIGMLNRKKTLARFY